MEARKKTNLKIMKIFAIIIGVIVLFAIIANLTSEDTAVDEVATQAIETDKAVTGLMPSDIYLNLEKKGYTTSKEISGNEGNSWRCIKKDFATEYDVQLFSASGINVEEMRATASLTGQENKNISSVKPFIKYISSFEYEGSDPDKVAQWIDNNFDVDGATITVGVAKFTLNGNKFNRVISIEKA